jgi:uncharacterized protein (UPF0548 family)
MRFVIGKWDLEGEKVRRLWGSRALSAGPEFKGRGRHDHYELELTPPAGWSPSDLFRWAAEEILCYRVFPPHRMRALVDGPGGRAGAGVTILQGVYVGPFRLQMADRVLEVFEDENEREQRAGFTYGTLQGHAERGIETFRVVREKGTSRVFYSMEAWSEPGHWLTRLFYSWARAVQKKAGREAIRFMEDKLKAVSRCASNRSPILSEVG